MTEIVFYNRPSFVFEARSELKLSVNAGDYVADNLIRNTGTPKLTDFKSWNMFNE